MLLNIDWNGLLLIPIIIIVILMIQTPPLMLTTGHGLLTITHP